MVDIDFSRIETEQLTLPLFTEKKIQADVLRLDKMHPEISGNKWFKLRYYLEEARQQEKTNIVTFGGAWSNHLLATAAACQLYGFSCTGIVRGERPSTPSPVISRIEDLGMELVFIPRNEYRAGQVPGKQAGPRNYIIAEGGYGEAGAKGAATISDYIQDHHYSFICCAAGTGTMAAGLGRTGNVIAISVLRNNLELEEKIRKLGVDKLSVIHDYHFGGYAKYTDELTRFMNNIYQQTSIPTDFVYTAKLFYAVNDLATKNHFDLGTRLLLIHSGGLIGNLSQNKGTLIF